MQRTQELAAVLKEDLARVLESLGELERVQNGLAYCSQCTATISLDNIGLFIPRESELEYVCNSVDCIRIHVEADPKRHVE